MLSYIALLPGLIAFLSAMKTSPQQAFIRVYLPALLFLPDYYRAITPGLPDPSFSQSASVGLFIASLARGFPGYRFSPMDLVVGGYAFCVSYSEFLASGYADAQNLVFAMLFSVLTPYLYAKSYIEPHGLRFDFSRRVVLILAAVAIVSIFETRMGANPWMLFFYRFFPDQGGWVTTFRFGFARVAGPFGHALLCGLIMASAFRLQRWLEWSQAWPAAWPPRFGFMRAFRLSPARFLSLTLFFGLLITFAKGSWVASIIAAPLVMVGRAKKRALAVAAMLGFIAFVLIPAAAIFLNWISVGRANATSENQETAAYRYELVVEYVDIARQQEDWGWGLTQWPKVPGMESIDNHYLLLLLMHGKWAFGLFMIVLLGTPARLIACAVRSPPPALRGGSLPFTLASIYLVHIVNIGTVYMGMQTVPLLFMFTGWAEGYLKSGAVDRTPGGATAAPAPAPLKPFRFRRVLR